MASDRPSRWLLAQYPELSSILEQAVDATVYTFEIDEDVDQDLIHDLEDAIAVDLIAVYAPIVATAIQTAKTVEYSRATRLLATARTAQVMAERVAEAAAALQSRGDESANTAALAASNAAYRLAASVVTGGEAAAATAAARVATAVHEATAAKAQERAEAQVFVAAEAAAAAAEVVDGNEQHDVLSELRIFATAAAVQAIALSTCYQVALNSAATAAVNKFKLQGRGPDGPEIAGSN